jgi:hypothetical protein
VTEISITTDRKEQVMLFIIMVASFTYNLIKLVLGPMEIFFIIFVYIVDIFLPVLNVYVVLVLLVYIVVIV